MGCKCPYEQNILVTIQDSPPRPYSHFEHCVFFPAFDKAKNAHKGVGSPIRTTVQKTKSLTCKHDDPLFLHSGPE